MADANIKMLLVHLLLLAAFLRMGPESQPSSLIFSSEKGFLPQKSIYSSGEKCTFLLVLCTTPEVKIIIIIMVIGQEDNPIIIILSRNTCNGTREVSF